MGALMKAVKISARFMVDGDLERDDVIEWAEKALDIMADFRYIKVTVEEIHEVHMLSDNEEAKA